MSGVANIYSCNITIDVRLSSNYNCYGNLCNNAVVTGDAPAVVNNKPMELDTPKPIVIYPVN